MVTDCKIEDGRMILETSPVFWQDEKEGTNHALGMGKERHARLRVVYNISRRGKYYILRSYPPMVVTFTPSIQFKEPGPADTDSDGMGRSSDVKGLLPPLATVVVLRVCYRTN